MDFPITIGFNVTVVSDTTHGFKRKPHVGFLKREESNKVIIWMKKDKKEEVKTHMVYKTTCSFFSKYETL